MGTAGGTEYKILLQNGLSIIIKIKNINKKNKIKDYIKYKK